MAIINIQTSETGLSGVVPKIIYIYTNDTLATISTAGYLDAENIQGYNFDSSQMALVTTKTNPNNREVIPYFCTITQSGSSWTLVPVTGGGSVTFPITTPEGGTGLTSLNPFALITGGTTSSGVAQQVASLGTSGQLLQSNGPGALPTWVTSGSAVTPSALTEVNDTNVTLTLGGTPSTALLQATSITAGWTGTLAVARGGSGLSSTTPYAIITGGTTGTGALQQVASLGTTGQVLTSGGAGALPTWTTITGGSGTVNSGTINDLAWYASTGTAVSGLATANSSGLLTNGSGVPAWVAYTGTGAPVLATSPTLVTPILGTPTSGTLTNCTGLVPSTGLAATGTPTASTYLRGDNAWVAGGISIAGNVQTLTGSGTYTPTAGTQFIIVEMIGGGGGSGGVTCAAGHAVASASGSPGAYLRFMMSAAQIGSSLSYSVGAFGAGGSATGPTNGSNGSSTTFGNWIAGGGAGSPFQTVENGAPSVSSLPSTVGTGSLMNEVQYSGNPAQTYNVGGSFYINAACGSAGNSSFSGYIGSTQLLVVISTGSANGTFATPNAIGIGIGGPGSAVYSQSTSIGEGYPGASGSAGTIVVTEFI